MPLIPIREHVWSHDFSYLRTVTCRNHPTARYLTKNPWVRSLHVVKLPDGFTQECSCPFTDLAVVVGDNGSDYFGD